MTAAYGVFAVALAHLAVVDLAELRIPNRTLLVAAVASVPLLTLASTSIRASSPGHAALIAVGFAAFFLALNVAAPSGIGFGDVKLAAYAGAHLGVYPGTLNAAIATLLAAFGMSVVGALGLWLHARRRDGESLAATRVPFAPGLAIAALASLAL